MKMEEMTWKEFLKNCDVSYWSWDGTAGAKGKITEVDPTNDPDFLYHEEEGKDVISWGGEHVRITNGVKREAYIVWDYMGDGKVAPLAGNIFASEEEAEECRKAYFEDEDIEEDGE